jgi:heme exporter protein D
MPDFGPHASFIWAAYGLAVLAIGALAAFVLTDDRRQRTLLAELERRGIRRRSASTPVAAPKPKPATAASKPISNAAAPKKPPKARPRRAAAPRRKSKS